MYWFGLIFHLILFIYSLIKISNQRRVALSPILILLVFLFLYTESVTISRIFFNSSPNQTTDNIFIICTSLAWIGVVLGILLMQRKKIKTKHLINMGNHKMLLSYSLFLFSILIYQLLKQNSFDLIKFLAPYGNRGEGQASMFNTLIQLAFIATSNYLYSVGSNSTYYRAKYLRRIAAVMIFTFALIFIIKGSRNIALMAMAPMFFTKFAERNFKVILIPISILLFYTAGYTIGIIRNYGFRDVDKVNISVKSFDPLNQEFGTMYSVFSKYLEIENISQPFLFGKTYFIDTLINLIPNGLWPNKPQGPAIEFSMRYYNVKNITELREGLGYSSLVEAIQNFGFLGILPIFLSTTILLYILRINFIQRYGQHSSNLIGFLSIMVLNWFRIDFATVFKIFSIYFISYLGAFFIYKIKLYEKN